jgi:regulator of protease activity HflC (stomatin/prohibitin superfamily)
VTSNDSLSPAEQPRKPNAIDRLVYRHRVKLGLFSLLSMFIMVLFWDLIVVPIPAGHQGVYWSRFFGGTANLILSEGTALKLPWDEITIYDIRMKEVHQTTTMLTKDGLSVLVTWSARFRPESNKLPELHKTIGPDFTLVAAIPELMEVLRHTVGNFRADQIYAGEPIFNTELTAKVKEMELGDHAPLTYDDLIILKFELPDAVSTGIQGKLLAEQTLLSYVFKLQAEEQEMKRKAIEAEGIRNFEKISGISILKWRGIDATLELSKSPNTKIVIMGTGDKSMPLLLNSDK